MKISTQEEALQYVDTEIRKSWDEFGKQGIEPGLEHDLGKAEIIQESSVDGHRAWQFHIDGLPMSRDNRKRWLLDNGDAVDTTLREDENTLEKAYQKYKSLKSAIHILAEYTGIEEPKLDIGGMRDCEVGWIIALKGRGASSFVVGNDGGILGFQPAGMSDDQVVELYKGGKRSEIEKV